MLQGLGMPAPQALAWLVGILEFAGGILILLGALTAVLSALFIAEMLVAAVAVHLPSGFNFMNITGMTEAGPIFGMPGYEVNVLYIAGFLALLLGGPGRYSVDARLAARRHEPREEGAPPTAKSPFGRRVPSWRRRAQEARDTSPRG